MDRILSMEIFAATVEAGSFAAVAERFGISPPMVGKHIRALESRLGARLLTRTTRRQSLTETGHGYYARCKSILDDIRAAESGVESSHASPRGRLRINAPVSFGAKCLPPVLADYLAAYPDMHIELTLNDHVIDLVDDGFDVVFRIGPLADSSSLVARALAPYRMLICAAPHYLARAGMPKTPADLAHHQCLGFTHWHRHGGWSLDRRAADAHLQSASRFEANNGEALRAAALHGFGLILQPEILLAEDVAAGRLVSVLQDDLPPPRPVHVLFPLDRQPAPKLRTFIDFVVPRFAHSLQGPMLAGNATA